MSPELTQKQLFVVIDRIIISCKGDYERARIMLEELQRWMSWDDEVKTYSKELIRIIVEVKTKKHE